MASSPVRASTATRNKIAMYFYNVFFNITIQHVAQYILCHVSFYLLHKRPMDLIGKV